MVDVELVTTNGERPRVLPAMVVLSTASAMRVPAPGTQRVLKAQTGKLWEQLMADDGEAADRFQTMIWVHLRRDIPDLRWEECADVEIQLEDGPALDPTSGAISASSPPSAASGV